MSSTNGTLQKRKPHSKANNISDNGSSTAVEDEHTHSHSHSLLHSHSHSHDGQQYSEAGMILEALKGRGDRGSRITLLGLFSNIALTGLKGFAGWWLNSASLIADAGHSLSDLLGDFVTLFCWTLSQRPPSDDYPYGFGKFESIGTMIVSLLLFAGGVGISLHSYALLLGTLGPTLSTLEPGALKTVVSYIVASASSHEDSHSAADDEHLDMNAVWFPVLGILVKEYLYRVTRNVAMAENSSVLMANALHHRSDAVSSLVTGCAILGSVIFPSLPLDPLGGILVGALILMQGIYLFRGALDDLTDVGVSAEVRQSIADAIPIPSTHKHARSIHSIRAVRSGAFTTVDLTLEVPGTLTVREAEDVQEAVKNRLRAARKQVRDIRVRLVAADD